MYLTDIERATLLTYVRFGSYKLTAAALGVPVSTVKNRLAMARQRTHTNTMAHLAAVMYPQIGHLYVIEHRRITDEAL
jgi:hypothetical protein